MSDEKPYHVLLDANIWIAERLLQSAIGSALLYAMTGAKASILLPEVVELEVNRILPAMAEKAVALISREGSLLRQLSGHNLLFTGPSPVAIEDGIRHRWKQLEGILIRVPFTHAQAKSALSRVVQKSAPSGENNEQFRDCCIWEAALSAATDHTVHLITADAAFYDGRNKNSGLASTLVDEIRSGKRDIRIYPALKDFLSAIGDSAAAIEQEAIGASILGAVDERAREIASETGKFELGASHKPILRGYATPKPSLVAISFEVAFDLNYVDAQSERSDEAKLTIRGICSYDPSSNQVSEIEVREWSTHLKGQHMSWGSLSPDKQAMERQYGPSRVRIISS
ncbi:PIN domain-containing protein [Bradyrhizobium sp. UFLA05-109]